MNEAEYTAIQNELQRGISLNDSFVLDEVRTVAGVDLAYWQEGGEVYGRTLRTHKGVRPVFVSVGNHVSLDTACELALRLTDK